MIALLELIHFPQVRRSLGMPTLGYFYALGGPHYFVPLEIYLSVPIFLYETYFTEKGSLFIWLLPNKVIIMYSIQVNISSELPAAFIGHF